MPKPSGPFRRALATMTLAAALALAGCGDDETTAVKDGSAAGDKATPTQPMPEPSTTLADAAGLPCKQPTEVPPAEGKPEVTMPEQPPAELVTEDLEPGDGAEAKLGDTIKVHYVGIACSTGMQFDSSWDSGQPADFQLAEGGLIKGWTQGIPGMKVGGRRKLVIPPDLAYGAEGRPGIAPNETLVFVIDLEDVTPAGEADPGTTTTVASDGEGESGGEDPATTPTTEAPTTSGP